MPKIALSQVKGAIAQKHADGLIYLEVKRLLRTSTSEPESIIRALAWTIGAVISSVKLSPAEIQRLVDLVHDDIVLIVAGGDHPPQEPQ